jgi:short-subunit dehydrogenase
MDTDSEPKARPLALVTGASSGIGEAFAERLAADGFDLVVVARRRERLETLKERLEAAYGVQVRPLAADLSTDSGAAEVDEVARQSPIDLLVDNAALAHYMPFLDLPLEKAEELVRLNVLGSVRLIRSTLPGMVERGRGTVVSIATQLVFSATGNNPQMPKRAVYASTKAFLFTFIRLLAQELQGTGVRLQVVCPGVVNTEFHTRQNMDLSDRPRFDPEQVVQASMKGLQLGELVCIPGLEDREKLQRHDEAEIEVMSGGLGSKLAERYLD